MGGHSGQREDALPSTLSSSTHSPSGAGRTVPLQPTAVTGLPMRPQVSTRSSGDIQKHCGRDPKGRCLGLGYLITCPAV